MRYSVYMNSETKTCSKCKRGLPVSQFYKLSSRKDGLDYYCIQCNKAQHKKWSSRPDVSKKIVAKVAEWKKQNRDKYLDSVERYNKKHKNKKASYSRKYSALDRVKKQTQAKNAERTQSLTDGTVRKMITAHNAGLLASEVPQSLIDLKRVQVQITRKLKESKKCKLP